ncbi:hypothetical protein [Glycomyces artemisiae]|uniref:Uncharacterized protein n=1 Tax=Glycomyces artemisiae TaxID=1076443 RepID=A0A2T0UEU8_9ACTN|nr:hypothetical protein [Glycomyces artemisiae]PRY56466.1 hypothetical protein B0I28_109115 [Glycomyces artemisiae]
MSAEQPHSRFVFDLPARAALTALAAGETCRFDSGIVAERLADGGFTLSYERAGALAPVAHLNADLTMKIDGIIDRIGERKPLATGSLPDAVLASYLELAEEHWRIGELASILDIEEEAALLSEVVRARRLLAVVYAAIKRWNLTDEKIAEINLDSNLYERARKQTIYESYRACARTLLADLAAAGDLCPKCRKPLHDGRGGGIRLAAVERPCADCPPPAQEGA